jgi:hypothetical protein
MVEVADVDQKGMVYGSCASDGSVHYVSNVYTWSDVSDPNNTGPDGTLFTDFLFTLNNRCANNETVACTRNTDCVRGGVGGRYGFAGPLASQVTVGIGLALFGSIVLSLCISLTSGYRSMVASAQEVPGAILALVAGGIVRAFPAETPAAEIMPTVVAAIALGSLASGTVYWLLGRLRLGSAAVVADTAVVVHSLDRAALGCIEQAAPALALHRVMITFAGPSG